MTQIFTYKVNRNKNTRLNLTFDEHISNIKHYIWLCCNNVSHNDLVDYVNNYGNSVAFIMNDKDVGLVFGIYDSTMHLLKENSDLNGIRSKTILTEQYNDPDCFKSSFVRIIKMALKLKLQDVSDLRKKMAS